VLYLKYLGNKAQLVCGGRSENLFTVFEPLAGVWVYIATLNFIPDFACGDQFAGLNQAIQSGPYRLEYTGEEMLELA
jgi:hypothetical protein